MSDQYGVRDAACPLSTRGGRGGGGCAPSGSAVIPAKVVPMLRGRGAPHAPPAEALRAEAPGRSGR